MSDTDAILALIDGALADTSSPDAMRWMPSPDRAAEVASESVRPASLGLTPADMERASDMLAEECDRRFATMAPGPRAPTLDDLLNLGRWFIDLPRVAVRLEVDHIALQVIRDRIPPGHEPATPSGRPVGGLFDLPVVLVGNLPPGGWRFIDADAEVLSEGSVMLRHPPSPPWLPLAINQPGNAIRISGV